MIICKFIGKDMPGFSSAINASLSSMDESSSKTASVSGNISNTDTNAYKRLETQNQSVVNSNIGSVAGVSSLSRQLVDVQGEMISTGVSTDLAIEGTGFAIVTDGFSAAGTPMNIFLTRDLSFRKDKTNMLANSAGYYLLAWGVDANGELPETKSLISSLMPVNVTQWVSNASATTDIEFGVNLESQEVVVGNAVDTINIVNRGVNGSRYNFNIGPNDILYPNPNNLMNKGEGLEVTINQPGNGGFKTTGKIIYDGFAYTSAFTNTTDELTTAVSGQNANDSITIQYGTDSIIVTRGNGTTNFEVLTNIANQINQNTPIANGLVARVVNFGTSAQLYISPSNINQGVTFSGNIGFRNKIGLDDTKNISTFSPDIINGVYGRFSTMKQFADILNSVGINTSVNYNESVGTTITLSSAQPVAFNNYQPLGKNSNFLSEFGLPNGYLQSSYDPYDATRNMAGGEIPSHFSQNVTIYDSMGNQQNIMLAFLKTGINKWNVEIYATDKQSVNMPGRTDGLLMASVISFDGQGHLQSIQRVNQYASSKELPSANAPLGATIGQTLTITTGATTNTYTYGSMIAQSTALGGNGTTLVGTATDTLDITVGSVTYNITRGNGADDLHVLNHMASQINATTGPTAIIADVVYDNILQLYHLTIRPADTTQGVAFAQTGTIGTNLGITSADDIAPNSFLSLHDLAEQINATTGINAVNAEIVPGNTKNSFRIKINPVNSNYFLSFGGTAGVINSPLGTGVSDTIANALNLVSTSSSTQLPSIDETLTINWSNIIGALPNTINFSWGTMGGVDGLGQVSGNYTIKKANQNGVSTGNLTGISIDPNGWITASFSNSLTRKIYKIPVASFSNPNGLTARPGNVYSIGSDSGPLNLKEAGIDGAGTFVSGSLEGSNVDLASELTKLIFAQRQYQASSKVINIVDSLLEELVHRTFG